MTRFTVSLDLSTALAAPDRCPGCGSSGLRPVTNGDRVHLLCPACWSCWDPELGVLTLVDPGTSGTGTHQEQADLAKPPKPRSGET
jgi:hypothetical protein